MREGREGRREGRVEREGREERGESECRLPSILSILHLSIYHDKSILIDLYHVEVFNLIYIHLRHLGVESKIYIFQASLKCTLMLFSKNEIFQTEAN